MFRVGQRVVCVDDGAGERYRWADGCELVAGQIYTIRAVGACDIAPYGPGVKLLEKKNLIVRRGVFYRDAHYRAARFRPVVERKTDISIFKAMLNPKKHELVDALPSRCQEGV